MTPGEELPFARLSFEFLRPVPMAPLKLTTRMSRSGRRVQALQAELEADGVTVCRASALRLVATPEKLPELALAQVDAARAQALAGPLDGQPVRFALDDSDHKSFASTAMEMRFLKGAPLVGELPELDSGSKHIPGGAAQVWMRLRHPVLEDRPLTPLARLAATSDFGNGVATVLPFEEYLFINADLTISLDRRPLGEMGGFGRSYPASPGRDRLGRECCPRRAWARRTSDAGARRAKPLAASRARLARPADADTPPDNRRCRAVTSAVRHRHTPSGT